MVCCHSMIGHLREVPSPFDRLIATDYYDGPTAGIVECATCRTVYSFEKIDWDDGQDLRVYSLAPIQGLGLDELVGHTKLRPHWPEWVLVGDATTEFGNLVQKAKSSSSPVAVVVVAARLLGTIKHWQPSGSTPGKDWFAEFAIDRRGR